MNKLSRIFSKGSLIFASLLMLPMKVFAVNWMPDSATKGPQSLDALIKTGLNTAIVFAAVVAVIFLVINGFKYMMASGDTTKTETAQKGIANALIGLVICIAAALIVNFVLGKLGLTATDIEGTK